MPYYRQTEICSEEQPRLKLKQLKEIDGQKESMFGMKKKVQGLQDSYIQLSELLSHARKTY